MLTKPENFRLWQSGAFGNKLRAWRSIEEWSDSGFQGLVALRTLGAGGGLCEYNLKPSEVEETYCRWRDMGLSDESIMVNEMAPDHSIALQGEYLNDIFEIDGEVGWAYFHFSRVKLPMRAALAHRPETAKNLVADRMLREMMTPSSYEDWLDLLNQYPGHVFEVSVYENCLGDTPNRNALVWEVRRY